MRFVDWLREQFSSGPSGALATMLRHSTRTADSWMDCETKVRKYRRHRAVRNAMAKASRRRNRRGA